MQVRFWGTRGSLAKPGPDTLRYGGNTSCVEVRSDSGTLVVIDCGTGAHALGNFLVNSPDQPNKGHLLISHTHWDHIQGIPFFAPLFIPGNEWDIYAPHSLGDSIQETLAGQMQYTYFPITLEALGAKIKYHDLLEGMFTVGDIKVRTRYLNHPALTLGYRLEVDGASVIYACDHEPLSRQPQDGSVKIGEQDKRHADFLRNASLVIHDAQYTAHEYANKIGWGHSTAEYAVGICGSAGVKRLALTHHDPLRNDDAVDEIVTDIRGIVSRQGWDIDVFGAAEGETIILDPSDPADTQEPSAEFASVSTISRAVSSHLVLLGKTNGQTTSIFKEAAIAEGIKLSTISDWHASGAQLEEDPPSLVIIDGSRFSRIDKEICSHIKATKIKGRPQAPIVVIADRDDEASDMSEIATDWILRPFTLQYARTRIRAWILRTTCRWIRAKIPENEPLRLASLGALEILDSEPEERFDRITRIASEALEVPMALVSLIDKDRQWFKSCTGLDSRETPRDMAFCAHAILDEKILIVPDALLDPRFADNPLVTGDLRVRFYAGCPIKAPDAVVIGTLCLIDSRPRQFNIRQINLLKDLAKLVEAELRIKANPGI